MDMTFMTWTGHKVKYNVCITSWFLPEFVFNYGVHDLSKGLVLITVCVTAIFLVRVSSIYSPIKCTSY